MEAVPLGPLEPTPPGQSDWDRADSLATEPTLADALMPFPLTMDQLRKVCEEAIARGQAYERARVEAWKRRLRFAVAVALPTLLGSAAAWCMFMMR